MRATGIKDLSLKGKDLAVRNKNKQDFHFTSRAEENEFENIKLNSKQAEEVNVDDCSLLLFEATRVEPVSLSQIKKYFPELSRKKAQLVMDRFMKCGLVHLTKAKKYYSNYLSECIDYSSHKYDSILEAKKDLKIFNLMKENFTSKDYWEDKCYFSKDGFFTKEQTKEIYEDLNRIKLKVKKYANENIKKKKLSDLTFRRFKYYDMILALMITVSFLITGYQCLTCIGQ